MSIIKNLFNRFLNTHQYNSRIKEDKEAIESTANYQMKCIQQINQENEAAGRKTPNASSGEDMQGWSGNAIRLFKDNMESHKLALVMDKYADLMVVNNEEGGVEYPHSCNTKVLFSEAIAELLPNNVLEMASYISRNDTFKAAIPIDDYNRNSSLIRGLLMMAVKCPVEDKIKFYSSLDSAGILKDCFSHGPVTPEIAMFVVAAFKGIDTPTALNMLEHSNSWRNLPKDQNLRDCLVNRDERLLPALQYSNI